MSCFQGAELSRDPAIHTQNLISILVAKFVFPGQSLSNLLASARFAFWFDETHASEMYWVRSDEIWDIAEKPVLPLCFFLYTLEVCSRMPFPAINPETFSVSTGKKNWQYFVITQIWQIPSIIKVTFVGELASRCPGPRLLRWKCGICIRSQEDFCSFSFKTYPQQSPAIWMEPVA